MCQKCLIFFLDKRNKEDQKVLSSQETFCPQLFFYTFMLLRFCRILKRYADNQNIETFFSFKFVESCKRSCRYSMNVQKFLLQKYSF